MPEFTGGKLKLKGGVVVKKKKKRGKTRTDEEKGEGICAAGQVVEESPKHEKTGGHLDTRTEAEKKFEKHALKYAQERAKKAASKSHRERIKELNDKLATLTEHHDIPRISYSQM